MIFSKYNVYYNNDNGLVVYNTLNKKIINIPTGVVDVEAPEKMSPIIKNLLKDFMVKDAETESRRTKYLMNSMIYQNVRLNITLMMTMKCNFQCVYCFESWLGEEEKKKELDEKQFVEWVKHIVKKYHIRQVDLCFHGGEPMLEIRKINEISKQLQAFFDNNNIFYLFTAVTNGYLINARNAELLREAKVKVVQITVDGVGEVHDNRRMLKNGAGTFDVIMDNIKNLEGIKCYINIVYDSRNKDNVKDLIDYFDNNNMHDKIDLIVIGSTKPIKIGNNIIEEDLSEKEEGDIRISLLKYIIDKGFKVPHDLEYQLCTLKQKSSFVINSQGKVYKCISGVGNKYFELCDFDEKIDPFEMQADILEGNNDKGCEECKYMPVCNKFCQYEAVVKNSNNKVCKKAYWDNYMPQYLEMIKDKRYEQGIVMDPNENEREASYNE